MLTTLTAISTEASAVVQTLAAKNFDHQVIDIVGDFASESKSLAAALAAGQDVTQDVTEMREAYLESQSLRGSRTAEACTQLDQLFAELATV